MRKRRRNTKHQQHYPNELSKQQHKLKRGAFEPFCKHSCPTVFSKQSNPKYFFSPTNQGVLSGSSKPADWKTYVHVRSISELSDGIDIQYWFFYPYNQFIDIPKIAHEGDWEHITITVNHAGEFHSAWYSQHNTGMKLTRDRLEFVDDSHPVVYSARGSHASFPNAGSWPLPNMQIYKDVLDVAKKLGFKDIPVADLLTDNTYSDGPKWHTWKSMINVGEKDKPINV